MLKDNRIAFIGGGNMTEALVGGLLAAGLVNGTSLTATDIRIERRKHLQNHYGISVSESNQQAAAAAQVVILSVEPQVLDSVLDELRPVLTPTHLVVSVAAGYPTSRVAARLLPGTSIVRVMPNTPSSIRAGVSAISFGPGVAEHDQAVATAIFESVGKVVPVDERLMDAATALSGSGPAYVYVMVEALADGGVKVGLPRPIAEVLAAQTVAGAAQMALETGEHPGRLKNRVASPGGTTIAGLQKLEEGAFRATLIGAIEAAMRRAAELGQA